MLALPDGNLRLAERNNIDYQKPRKVASKFFIGPRNLLLFSVAGAKADFSLRSK
jgi:hypothetical protein